MPTATAFDPSTLKPIVGFSPSIYGPTVALSGIIGLAWITDPDAALAAINTAMAGAHNKRITIPVWYDAA